MAVVTARYFNSAAQIKATVRYMQHRAGRDGEKITRTLFGVDGALPRQEVYQLIDAAPPGAVFYHLKISPDPKREDSQRDLDLRAMTNDTLFALSQKVKYHVEYAGVVHDDHTPIRHMHVIAVAWKKLDREDLKVLRESATAAALQQRQERDRNYNSLRVRRQHLVPPRRRRRLRIRGRGSRYKQPVKCLICGTENCKEHDLSLDLQLEREI